MYEEQIIVNSEGWKGKSDIQIIHLDKKRVILRQWRKDKETKENYSEDTEVEIEDIKFLWNLLRKHCDVGKVYGPHYVWRLIIREKKLAEKEGVSEDYMVSHFLGYRQKRKGTDYYFRYYFYPIKCLESQDLGINLTLFGKGGIMIHHKRELII